MFNEEWIIYKVVAGSHCYGTATEESDIDIRGIAIPDSSYFYGFSKKFEQYEDKGKDTCIFDIRKFFQLAAAANPNILELLFIDEKWIKHIDRYGQKIRDNRNLFLSAKCRWTYSGYAFSQLEKIKRHRNWLLNPVTKRPIPEDFGIDQKWKIGKDEIGVVNALTENIVNDIEYTLNRGSYNIDPNGYVTIDRIKLYDVIIDTIQNKINLDISAISNLGGDLLLAYSNVKRYYQALSEYNKYEDWKKNRNPKRAELEKKFGFDCKFAKHLVRLVIQAKEILTEGKLEPYVANHSEVIEVSKGEWSYDKLIKWSEEKDSELKEIYDSKKYVVPHHVDINKIDDLCKEIVEEKLK